MASISEIKNPSGGPPAISPLLDAEAARIREIVREKLKLYRATLEERAKRDGIGVVRSLVEERYGLGKSTEGLLRYADGWVFFPFQPIKEVGAHVLLHGPPGTGKSFFIGALAEKSGAYVLDVGATTLVEPAAFQMLHEHAKVIRRISIGELIEQDGGIDKAREKLTEILLDALEKEGKITKTNRTEKGGEVRAFLNDHIRTVEELVMLCAPSNENDCQLASAMGKEFNSEFRESNAGEIFETLVRYFPGIPVIVFIDEIDRVGDRRLGSNPVLNSIFTAVDGGSQRRINAGISFVGATNELETIDRALTRRGRMDLLLMPYPDAAQRRRIAEVMIKRFTDALNRINESVIRVIAGLPLMTGADVWGLLSEIARRLRSEKPGTEVIEVADVHILERLSDDRGEATWLSKEPALSVTGQERIVDMLSGRTPEAPFLYRAYALYERLTTDDSTLLPSRWEGIEFLRDASALLACGYSLGKGTAIRVPSEEVATWLVEEMQHRLLAAGTPMLVTELYADRLLHGIVGSTRRNVDSLFAKLSAMGESVIVIRNLDALLTGSYVGEWQGAVMAGIRELRRKGCAVIGCADIPLFDSAFGDLVLFPLFSAREAHLLFELLKGRTEEEVIAKVRGVTASSDLHTAERIVRCMETREELRPSELRDGMLDVVRKHAMRLSGAAREVRRGMDSSTPRKKVAT